MAMTGLYGGAFDPPHNGHVALAAGRSALDLPRLIVLVSEHPGHKETHCPPEIRLELARAAFPDDDVRLDPYPRTIDLLRGGALRGAALRGRRGRVLRLPSWKEPDEILELAELGVGTRPGFPRERLDSVLDRLSRPTASISSRSSPIRGVVDAIRARRSSWTALVPPAVAARIGAGHYRPSLGATLIRRRLVDYSLEQARRIAALAQEKLAEDVLILDMRSECTFTDYFVIATGRNARQTVAI